MTNPAIENRLDDYQEDQEDQETKSTARWDELPVDCLAQIFDDLLRAPTPHPSYLSGKLKSWSALFRTCSQWKRAIRETGVGVCLPKTLEPRMIAFLKMARIRGLELHDPDHTDNTVIGLLGDKDFLASSSQSMQSIVDVPFQIGGLWSPSDFTNLSHLTIRNPHHQGPQPTSPISNSFDCKAVSGMKNLRVLVLAAGFNSLENMEFLPETCKQMMINCPGQPQTSHLSITEWPESSSLEWFSISTHTLQIGFNVIRGKVKQLHVHAAFVFLDTPKEVKKNDRAPPKQKLTDIAELILHDSNLMEAQLTCEVLVVGSRPEEDELNTLMLSGSPLVDISAHYTEVSNSDFEGALLSAYSALLAESARVPGGDRVQMEVAQFGPELELTIVRQKEGEKGSLALRLDAIGIDPEEEVEKLISELQVELQAGKRQAKTGIFSQQSSLYMDQFACSPPSSTTYRSVTFPRWSYEEDGQGEQDSSLEEFYDACEDLSISKTPPPESFVDCVDRPSVMDTSSPGPSKGTRQTLDTQLPIASHLRLSTRLLASSSFHESSRDYLTEVNGLLVPPHSLRPYYPSLQSLLNPYFALTALFCTTLGNELPLLPDSCFPTTLQELYLTAGHKGQRFITSAIENLVELRRLNLRGYATFDLSTMPALRPGLCLVISDMDLASRPSLPFVGGPFVSPPQAAPIGSPAADVTIPRGRIIEVSVNITLSDAGAPQRTAEAQRRGGMLLPPPSASRALRAKRSLPLDVDISAWSSTSHGIHAQALPGVHLHAAACTSLSSFVHKLTADGLDHLVIVTTVLMPNNQMLAVPGRSNFKIVLDRGRKVIDGLELLFAVSQNAFPAWQVQWNFEGGMDDDDDEEEDAVDEGDEGGEQEEVGAGGADADAANMLQDINIEHVIQELAQALPGHPPPTLQQVQAALHIIQGMGQLQAGHGHGHGQPPAAAAGNNMRSRVICIAFHRKAPGEMI